MLSNYVGEEKFLKGVSLYLKKKLYANSVTHDLWEGISTATGLDITELMENWITKIGFPVLTVTEDAKGITVRQDRFLEMGPADPKDNKTIWLILFSTFFFLLSDLTFTQEHSSEPAFYQRWQVLNRLDRCA